MHVSMDVKALQAGMAVVVKSLSSKPSLQILEGVYAEADKSGLLLRCSDLSLQIDCLIPATVDEEGAAVLPGRLFSDFVRRIDGETVDIRMEGRGINLRGGRARASLQCLDPKEFPDMALRDEVCSISLPQAVLKEMIRQTAFAVATEDGKPILMGVLFEIMETELCLVALDGFRLAMRKHDTGIPQENREFVVPAKSIQEIGRSLLDTEEPVTLQFSRTHLRIDMGSVHIISRLLDGNFIKYRGLLPASHNTRVRVNRTMLLESIERANLLSREGGNNLVRFDISAHILKISANGPMGKLDEEMEIHLNGAPLEIAFNARYFSDVLRVLNDEEIYLDMNNNVSPCVLRPIQGEGFYYLVLPVRIFS